FVLTMLGPGVTVRADLLLTLEPGLINASPGDAGSFEVILTNTSRTSVDIATFNYQLLVAETAPVSLVGVSNATSIEPYIFGGDGFGIAGILGNDGGFNTLTVSDFLNDFVPPASPVSLGAGARASLGLIQFQVDPSATSQDVPVSINNVIDFTFVA